MPGFSYIATAETVALLGAKPIYIDIDPKTYNMDPTKLEAAITTRTKAIIPVSLYGQCADFDAINAIAKKHNLSVIEDGAQSFGGSYKGRKSCNLSEIGCTSFFPTKPLGCYGDGGAIFTSDDELARVLRQIARHGQNKRYHHIRVGVNSRLDTLQAAILLAKLDLFPQEVDSRQLIANRYNDLFTEIGYGSTQAQKLREQSSRGQRYWRFLRLRMAAIVSGPNTLSRFLNANAFRKPSKSAGFQLPCTTRCHCFASTPLPT